MALNGYILFWTIIGATIGYATPMFRQMLKAMTNKGESFSLDLKLFVHSITGAVAAVLIELPFYISLPQPTTFIGNLGIYGPAILLGYATTLGSKGGNKWIFNLLEFINKTPTPVNPTSD